MRLNTITKNLILLILITGIFTNCNVTQNGRTNGYSKSNKTKPASNKVEAGKCLAKCLMPTKYDLHSEEYSIFTGNELEEKVDIETKQIELKPKTTKWEKKKKDRNCKSQDPNDCLVWCLIEIPAVTREIKILRDTTQSKNYEIEKINYEVLNKKGGYTEWKEVLCEQDITRLILGQVQNSLREKGFYKEENTFKLDTRTKASLTKFQRENNLPVGNLDFETLGMLEINVK